MLRFLPPVTDPNVLVGASTNDDAAVYRLGPELAAVATVDYITPVVDDPFTFGAVAAANSLSDIYAMGATPQFALSLVNFPRDSLPFTVLEEIVRGAVTKAGEAGIAIIGGHSVDDREPKFGLAVYGVVHPDQVVRNDRARPGDRLVLTKALGTGIVLTALMSGVLSEREVQPAVTSMLTLNRAAAEAMQDVGVHAATDVSGFGLLGHLSEMVRGSNVGVLLDVEAVPFLPGALSLAERDVVPSGTRRNLDAVSPLVDWEGAIGRPLQLALADAQTSGGLLIAVDPRRAHSLADALASRSVPAWWIGEFTSGPARIRFH